MTDQPDAPASPDAPSGNWTVGCVPQTSSGSDAFDDPSDFGPTAPGSLAGWNPDGRWFITSPMRDGASSVHLARDGAAVVFDRYTEVPGTIDDTAAFQRATFSDGSVEYIYARRISDLEADGSLRYDLALCEGSACEVCSAVLIRAAHHDPQPADKLALVGQLYDQSWEPAYTFNVRVVGSLAYVIRQDGLKIIDTSNPALPVQVGAWRRNGDGYSNDVKLVETNGKRYAIIADTPVDVVDVTNPAAPMMVAQILEEAHTLFVETRNGKTLAYFGNYDGSTPVYDVTNPVQPMEIGSYASGGFLVHDLSVKDGIAYLNAWNLGMLAVDFNNPGSPQLLGTFPSPTGSSHSSWTTVAGGRPIALSGDEGWGAHLDVVDNDRNSPTYMQSIAKYKTRDWVSIHNVMAFGNKAYFTYYQDGVRVLDLSNPTAPVLAGYYNTWDPQADYATSAFFDGAIGLDVDLTRKLIFVADARGLLILRDDT